MRRRIVWVVSNDQSPDIPDGVVAVYAKKACAVSLAVECMQAAAEGRYTRHEVRRQEGVAIYWHEATAPYEMSVVPFEVQP